MIFGDIFWPCLFTITVYIFWARILRFTIFLGGYNNYPLKLLCAYFGLRVEDSIENYDILRWLYLSSITVVHILGLNVTVHDILRCGKLELGSYQKTCELYVLISCGQHNLTCTKFAALVPARAQ